MNQSFDVVIIGSGFAGLAAAVLTRQQGQSCALISHKNSASLHFSGAFDLGTNNLSLFDQAQKLFKALDWQVSGDGKSPLWVIPPSGQVRQTLLALPSHAITEDEAKKWQRVAVLDVPILAEQPAGLIEKGAQSLGWQTQKLTWSDVPLPRISPLAAWIQACESGDGIAKLLEFLRPKLSGYDAVIVPAVLATSRHQNAWMTLQNELGVRVVETLCVPPSAAGLRLQNTLPSALKKIGVVEIKARVSGFEKEENSNILKSIIIDCHSEAQPKNPPDQSGGSFTSFRMTPKVISGKKFILATGKYLGGGIRHEGHFFEPLLGLPLYCDDRALTAQANIAQHFTSDPLAPQDFMRVGVKTDLNGRPTRIDRPIYDNLHACGHILTGFDFARDHCGFGVSLASAIVATSFS